MERLHRAVRRWLLTGAFSTFALAGCAVENGEPPPDDESAKTGDNEKTDQVDQAQHEGGSDDFKKKRCPPGKVDDAKPGDCPEGHQP